MQHTNAWQNINKEKARLWNNSWVLFSFSQTRFYRCLASSALVSMLQIPHPKWKLKLLLAKRFWWEFSQGSVSHLKLSNGKRISGRRGSCRCWWRKFRRCLWFWNFPKTKISMCKRKSKREVFIDFPYCGMLGHLPPFGHEKQNNFSTYSISWVQRWLHFTL